MADVVTISLGTAVSGKNVPPDSIASFPPTRDLTWGPSRSGVAGLFQRCVAMDYQEFGEKPKLTNELIAI